MDSNFWTRFFKDRDDTGRYVVVSYRTGKRYAVEPIDESPSRQIWGDVDPATKTIQGSYGHKHHGSVHPKASMVTEANGFKNVVELGPGESPESYIERIDAGYPAIER